MGGLLDEELIHPPLGYHLRLKLRQQCIKVKKMIKISIPFIQANPEALTEFIVQINEAFIRIVSA